MRRDYDLYVPRTAVEENEEDVGLLDLNFNPGVVLATSGAGGTVGVGECQNDLDFARARYVSAITS